MILTVDLAAKYSAYMVMDGNLQVLCQGDSRGKSSFFFVDELLEVIGLYDPTLIIVEDVPYGISSQAMVKPVLRLQGILIHALGLENLLGLTFFVNPSTWQKNYPGVARGKADERIEAARAHAERLGYLPPDLVGEYIASLPEGKKVLKKNTDGLYKTQTDYVDAYLMADWVYSFETFEELRDLKGVQPVFL